MKKLFLIMMLVSITLTANAQAYLGGTLGITVDHTSYDGGSMTNSAFSVSPEGGYYFNKTFAVGASIAIQQHRNDYIDATKYSILPYVRGIFAHASVFDFFGELALGYESEDSIGGFVLGIRPGFIAHLSNKFGLIGRTTILRYSHYDNDDENNLGFAINNNLELGVQITF